MSDLGPNTAVWTPRKSGFSTPRKPENMNISVNGESQVPPGFRFHPTEEELLLYYLRKKVSNEKIDLDVIIEVDLNKLEPWDIQERCKIGTTPQNDWYVFSHKDKKYPTGTRTNRATLAGFWKATGRDKLIYSNFRLIGMRKTLVFYTGRAPHGLKSSWIMHEYRFDDNISFSHFSSRTVANVVGDATQEDGWVVCRLFQKKNQKKTLGTPLYIASSPAIDAAKDQEGISEETAEDIDRLCREDDRQINSSSSLLEPIDCSFIVNNGCHRRIIIDNNQVNSANHNSIFPTRWGSIDHLVASQLNCDNQTAITVDYSDHQLPQFPTVRTTLPYSAELDYNNDYDLWSFLDDHFY